ncbi:MAG: 2Fe-2S iron-sulfur cluster-binding protein [Rhizobiaceae bacterium]
MSRRIGTFTGGKPISFTFEGMALEGIEGDTIASALLANGVRITGRSFKYHRARGIWGGWQEEPNAIVDVQVDGRHEPNCRASVTRLTEGMRVLPVNASPGVSTDRAAILDRLARFIPAGFYYKTFMLPDWHVFEPRIRAMAGLGRIDTEYAPPADGVVRNHTCDVLVIGAGPAGLGAAAAAAASSKSVMLVDDRNEPGGTLLWQGGEIAGKPGREWARGVAADLAGQGHVVLSSATAYGVFDHGLVTVWQRRDGKPDRLWQVRPERIVLASGAIERPLVFPDNDRPGVMSADAALQYLALHGVLVGERIVIVTNNSAGHAAGEALADAGAEVAIADTRGISKGDGRLQILSSARIEAVHGARGVEAVTVAGKRIPADCLLVSGGFTPSVHLHCQARGRLVYDEAIAAFVPKAGSSEILSAGAANGTFDLGEVVKQGHAAGGGKGKPPGTGAARSRYMLEPSWPDPANKGRQWIDFQNDVTLKDVELAARESFRSVEHLKRYTTLGMATDQGKTSNMNGLAAMAAITGRSIEETGTTTYRPPFVPVPFTVLAGKRRGELYNPVRRLTLENEHRKAGAVFREYGGWLRPAWYGKGDAAEAIAREARMARECAGILDGSPLGKIEVMGPQAGALLDFNFYQRISTLKPGRIRYAFMLTEGGVIYDDGVVSKVSDNHYVVSCSSGHVAGVVSRLEEFRQDRFDQSQVFVHNSTPQWATLTVSGPRSREIVAKLGLGVDLSDEKLPHMAFADGQFQGGAARLARVSFTGDRSYEVSVGKSQSAALFKAMLSTARAFGGAPMGSEALLLLRAEKGYIIAGKDTDGTTMPHDLGMTGPRDKRQDEYAGRRSLFTDNARRVDRQQAVGLEACDGGLQLPTGAHGLESGNEGHRSIGFVTSSYDSPTLGRPVALALIERGMERMGEEIVLYHLGANRRARIIPACVFDPAGGRLNA